MENEIYEILGIDRNQFFFRMKYEYNQCNPQSVRRDRDVRNFVRVVKKFKPVTPLYVEVLLRVPQFNNVDEENTTTKELMAIIGKQIMLQLVK